MCFKKVRSLGRSGQAAVEYLLVLAAVLLALSGVEAAFRIQRDRYLSVLEALIQLPF